MKKLFCILTALTLALACAPAFAETPEEAWAKLPEEIRIQYSDIVAEWVDGMYLFDEEEAAIDADVLGPDEIEDLKMDLMFAHDCGSFGYTVADLNGDGKADLVIASGKLILGVWTYGEMENADGSTELAAYPALRATDTIRFYYAGNGKFADVTCIDGEPVYETAYFWDDGNEFADLGDENRIDPADYVQLELTPVYPVQE